MVYRIIYECCVAKCRELGIEFDFDNNQHIQHPNSMNDIYKNFVYHSQNRSQGGAINFFRVSEAEANSIWNVINNYEFNFNDNYDYLNLFNQLKNNAYIRDSLSLTKGKDIQYIELAKTCQCIKKYLTNFHTINDFVAAHTFTNDANNNWTILNRVASEIYNIGTELVPDFFKEQDCINGREYLIKADVHVKRFFSNYKGRKLTDRQVYSELLSLYNSEDQATRQDIPPYKLDKLIYLIGEYYGNPNDSLAFAQSVLQRIEQERNL